MKIGQSIASALVLMLAVAPAVAQVFRSGDITIEQPWSRATPKGAPVAGGYMVIHNAGTTADRLTGGVFDFAGKVQIHEMTMQDGVMKMRPLATGLEIPPGGTVTLAPNGYHVMFMELKRQLTQGETVKGALDFEHAGKIPVEFKVGGMGDRGPAGTANTPAPDTMPGHDTMPMDMPTSMPMQH
jgi:copper(I)-binding protein